jgi:hypothetical protein
MIQKYAAAFIPARTPEPYANMQPAIVLPTAKQETTETKKSRGRKIPPLIQFLVEVVGGKFSIPDCNDLVVEASGLTFAAHHRISVFMFI